MNPEQQKQLEAKLTALLLGELPASEAFELGRAIEHDPELAKLYQRLEKTIGLVRETSSARAAADQPEAPASLRLSDECREALLQKFKTVRPKTFAVTQRVRRKVRVLGVAAVFASFVAVVSVAVFSLSSKYELSSKLVPNDAAASARAAYRGPSQTDVLESGRPVTDQMSRELRELARRAHSTPARSQPEHSPIVLPTPETADAWTGDRFYTVTAGSAGEEQHRGSLALNSKSDFTTDPEWLGLLERPAPAHSGTNVFIGRYASMTPPTQWSMTVSGVSNYAGGFLAKDSDGDAAKKGAEYYLGNKLLTNTSSDLWGNAATRAPAQLGSEVALTPRAEQPAEQSPSTRQTIAAGVNVPGNKQAVIDAKSPAAGQRGTGGGGGGSISVGNSTTPHPSTTQVTDNYEVTSVALNTAALPPTIDPATGLPLPMPEIAAEVETASKPQVRTFEVDPSKLADGVQSANGSLTGGSGGGGGGRGGIANVTRTNNQIAVQENLRKLLADSGVILNPGKGETAYYNDRTGRLIVSADEEKLRQIDSVTRKLQPPVQAAGDSLGLSRGVGDSPNDIVNLGDVPLLGRLFTNGTTAGAGKSLAATEGGAAANYQLFSESVGTRLAAADAPGLKNDLADGFAQGQAGSAPELQKSAATNMVVAGSNFWDSGGRSNEGSTVPGAPRQQIVLPPAEQQLASANDVSARHDWFDAEKKGSGSTYDRSAAYRSISQAGTAVAAADGSEIANGTLQQLNRSKLQHELKNPGTPEAGNLALNFSTTPAQTRKPPGVAGAIEGGRQQPAASNVYSQQIVGYANIAVTNGTVGGLTHQPRNSDANYSDLSTLSKRPSGAPGKLGFADDDGLPNDVAAPDPAALAPREVKMEIAKAATSDGGSSTIWNKISGKYERKAQIAVPEIERRASGATEFGIKSRVRGSTADSTVENERVILRSDDVLGRVVDELKLDELWAGKDAERTARREKAIGKLRGMVGLKAEQTSNLWDVTVKSEKPQEAAKIANAVAQSFIDVHQQVQMREAIPRAQVVATPVAERAITQAQADRLSKEAEEKSDLAPRKPSTNAAVHQAEIITTENAFSTFSLNVSDVSFKLAAASLEKGVLPDPTSVRSEEFINAFDYRDPEPPAGVPVGFAWDRAQYPFAQNRDLLRFSIKTAAQGRQSGSPLNIVLLLDNSGSMERADRVHIIHESLRVLAGQLQAQDKLSVVLFSRTARLLVDGVSGTNATKVAEEVGGLTPEGGTNLEEAMNLAYQTATRHYLANGVNRVVLLTDGAANLGDVEPESLKQEVETNRKQGIALDCFGIGWEGYNDDLLEVLSRNGDGRYGFINSPEEAASQFAGQLAGALNVAASDVKVQVGFNPARVKAWRQIGYAKHQLTKEQFRDNTVDAAEIAAAESGNALYVIEVNPNGEGPLGTVRVRFKVPGTSDYREHEWAVPYSGNALALEQSSPAMRLAATASAFSEWLAANPYAGEINLDHLLGCLGGVPETFGADPRPKRLEWMLRQTKSLAGK